MSERLEAARALDALGWNVLPAPEGGKAPTVNWRKFQDQRTSTKLRLWFGTDAVNLFVMTGSVSQLLVLDADSEGAEAFWRDLIGDALDATTTATTRKGHHYYFSLEQGQVVRSWSHHKGPIQFDVRAEGSGVVAPPSVHESGHVYTWVRGPEHIQPVPRVLLSAADAGLEARPDPGAGGDAPQSMLSHLLSNPAGEGGRNNWLTQVCGHYARMFRSQQDTYLVQARIAARLLSPPLDDQESERTIESVWRAEQRQVAERCEGTLPRIELGPISADLASRGWEALIGSNDPPRLYRSGGQPTRLERDDDGGPRLLPLTPARMAWELAHAAEWWRGGEQPRRVDPPASVVAQVLATPDPLLPVLTRIVAAPVFGADGSLQASPGYHAGSRTLYEPLRSAESVPPVPDVPSDGDLLKARTVIDELICDFPFAGEADRAHAVGLLLLPFLRDLIDGPTPLHLFDKPSPGTGASLLTEVLLIAALGRAPASLGECRDREEWRKRITSLLASGVPVVLLDNLTGKLDSAALCAALTMPVWEDRILGESRIGRWPVRCCWVATANNLTLSTDIARRTVHIRLDAHVEQPWTRQGFRHDLPGWAFRNRAALVWSALCAGRAWIARGRPSGSARPLGAFEGWSAVVGGVLDVLGYAGFLSNTEELYTSADGDAGSNRWLASVWWSEYRGRPIASRELFNHIAGHPECPFSFNGAQQLGLYLAGIKDRHISIGAGRTVRVERSPGQTAGSWKWRLASAEEFEFGEGSGGDRGGE